MGQAIELQASDGHKFGAYRADPSGAPRGGIVIIQEIFGVNDHIRSVCDRTAELGYLAIAPALFDRVEPGFESGYSPEEIEAARAFIPNLDLDLMMADISAAAAAAQIAGPVGVIGFCLGGFLAFQSATRLTNLKAAVGYYGGRIVQHVDQVPNCPTQLHFGSEDKGIPLSDVDKIKSARPDCDIHVYVGADHGFHCDARATFHQQAAMAAWARTHVWLERHMGGSE